MEELKKNPLLALASYKTSKDADKLAALLQEASDAYYNRGQPMLPDDIFDMAKEHLESIAPKHPFLTQVGAPIAEGEKVQLPFWMGSMNKIKDSEKDLLKWVAKYPKGAYVISDKLDGNSAMLVYGTTKNEGGLRMVSRGDGTVGQDISQLIPHIQGIPKAADVPPGMAVRGELIIAKKDWDTIRHVGANARNVVAGALHRKVPDANIAKFIQFVAYDVVFPRNQKPSDAFQTLTGLGFIVVHHTVLPDKSQVTLEHLSQILMDRRKNSPYECDGIIVAHNDVHRIVKGTNPSYAFAFKSIHTHEEAEVVVSHVEWNISKDGYIKPTVIFPAVSIAGVKIQRATGFNGAFIESHKIGPGARIVIIRSGDVIPHVVRVLTPAASGAAQMPDAAYEWTDTHVDIMVRDKDSLEQRIRTLEHFAKTLDIPNVAAGTLKKLTQAGFDTIPKLLAITEADLLKIEGFKSVSAKKVANAVRDVREKATCVQMMAASNLFGRGMGEKKLQMIVKALPQILERKLPSVEELQTIEGVGPSTADSFHEGVATFFKLMDELSMPCRATTTTAARHTYDKDEIVAQMENMTIQTTKSHADLSKLVVVFTGFRAKEWEAAITTAGGKVTTSVSKNTTHVVAADPTENSSKLEKARTLGIPILTKPDFAKTYHLHF